MFTRLVLESGLKFVFTGLGLGLETQGVELKLGLGSFVSKSLFKST